MTPVLQAMPTIMQDVSIGVNETRFLPTTKSQKRRKRTRPLQHEKDPGRD